MCAWKVVIHSDLNVSVVVMPGFLEKQKLEVLGVYWSGSLIYWMLYIFIPRVGI